MSVTLYSEPTSNFIKFDVSKNLFVKNIYYDNINDIFYFKNYDVDYSNIISDISFINIEIDDSHIDILTFSGENLIFINKNDNVKKANCNFNKEVYNCNIKLSNDVDNKLKYTIDFSENFIIEKEDNMFAADYIGTVDIIPTSSSPDIISLTTKPTPQNNVFTVSPILNSLYIDNITLTNYISIILSDVSYEGQSIEFVRNELISHTNWNGILQNNNNVTLYFNYTINTTGNNPETKTQNISINLYPIISFR